MNILVNKDISYKQMEQALGLMPNAIGEAFGMDISFNPLKTVHLVTGVISGQYPTNFFAAAVENDEVIGFMGGYLESYAFADYSFAQDIIAYVVPNKRDSQAYLELSKAFEVWAKGMGAKAIRGLLTNSDNAQKTADAAIRYGYKKVGIIITKDFGEQL